MKTETKKTIAIVSLIILIAVIILGYAIWNDGFKAGRNSIERDIFKGLVYTGHYNFFVTDGNATQVIKLVPYIENGKS